MKTIKETRPRIVQSGKMTLSEYRMLHYWVERELGKPNKCETCLTEEDRRYMWANLSGEYMKDVTDWRRLCGPCHAALDGLGSHQSNKKYCVHGHEYTDENTIRDWQGYRKCHACQLRHQAKWRNKQRAKESK